MTMDILQFTILWMNNDEIFPQIFKWHVASILISWGCLQLNLKSVEPVESNIQDEYCKSCSPKLKGKNCSYTSKSRQNRCILGANLVASGPELSLLAASLASDGLTEATWRRCMEWSAICKGKSEFNTSYYSTFIVLYPLEHQLHILALSMCSSTSLNESKHVTYHKCIDL